MRGRLRIVSSTVSYQISLHMNHKILGDLCTCGRTDNKILQLYLRIDILHEWFTLRISFSWGH
jgi:hypothetical protein